MNLLKLIIFKEMNVKISVYQNVNIFKLQQRI